ncbi:hypothetical protein [Xanthomonas hortorum]|uniref:hypothetical protein n=1 Tax=Xanthomonas hortorum TaxID=56454 RepID=UPI001F3AD74B|nr:hypothetical protein [Xanthomonas hortorum]MCE4364311.1 hypothetical protein [Xanthomonas hortorum]
MAIQRTTPKSRKPAGAKAAKAAVTGARNTPPSNGGSASAAAASPKPSDPGVNTMNRILLVDLGERETKKRQELRARRQVLDTIDKTADSSGGLSPRQLDELARIRTRLSSDVVVDPFYQVVVATQQQKDWNDLSRDEENIHKYGLIGSQRTPKQLRGPLGSDEREIIGICGLLQLDGYTDASLKGFVQRISTAQGEYRENRALFQSAFELLVPRYQVTLQSQIASGLIDPDIIGCEWPNDDPEQRRHGYSTDRPFVPAADDIVCALSARNLSATVRRLASNGIRADNAWLASHLQNSYEMQTGVVSGAPPSAMEIILPDLDESTDVEIVRENLNAVQAIYFSYMLEETRMPQVVERIVELFRSGMLPLGRGKAGDYLFRYYKTAAERITEGERRDLYMRCFGAPGGDPNGNEPNREFNELWLRFVSAVSSFGRQLSVDRMLRTNIPVSVSQEQVRKAARDLGASMSRSGYGIAYFAATELQQMILEYRDLLSDPEVRGAFGARDMWQVIDQVNANYLGGPRNTSRFRTQARAGAVIIRWIANSRQRLEGRYGEVISISALTNPQLRGSDQPTVDPTDWDLLQACEQWLAVGGVQDNSVEQYARPMESPVITSRPIEIPQAARDLLDQAGISLPGM